MIFFCKPISNKFKSYILFIFSLNLIESKLRLITEVPWISSVDVPTACKHSTSEN